MDTNPTPQPSVWPPLVTSAVATGATLFYIAADLTGIAVVCSAVAVGVPFVAALRRGR